MIGRTTPTERVRNYRGETYNGCVSPLPWAGLPPRVAPVSAVERQWVPQPIVPGAPQQGRPRHPLFRRGLGVDTGRRDNAPSAFGVRRARTAVARRLHGGVASSGPRPAPAIPLVATNRRPRRTSPPWPPRRVSPSPSFDSTVR